jgi:hypothetical protein
MSEEGNCESSASIPTQINYFQRAFPKPFIHSFRPAQGAVLDHAKPSLRLKKPGALENGQSSTIH